MVLGLVMLLSIAHAAYPFKAVRRVDELVIPFCLDQRGYKCNVCGYNEELKTFTAPNSLSTACLPSANGCTKYLDLTGTVCDPDAWCSCGFTRNWFGVCIPTPTGFQNCALLHKSGAKCEQCVDQTTLQYGGGHGDFGKSADETQCIDNTATNKPFCGRYKTGDTECAKCQDNYAFNSQGVCIKLNIANSKCELASDSGICIKCYADATFDSSDGQCTPLAEQTNWCLQWAKLPNGIENKAQCIQCSPGYLITKTGCSAITTNGLFLETGAADAAIGRWCLGAIPAFDSKNECAIPLTQKADYKDQVTEPTAANNCLSTQTDDAGTCPSYDDCFIPYGSRGNLNTNALFYDKNTQKCHRITDQKADCSAIVNCQISDGLGSCETCHDGFSLANGVCKPLPNLPSLEGCKEVNADGKTCKTCYTSYVSVDGDRFINRFYKFNAATNLCVKMIDNVFTQLKCLKIDDNALCTQCREGYQIVNGECVLATATTPVAPYGCKTFADNKCSEPLPGFTCDGGYECWLKDITHNCLKFQETGDCETCILPHFYITYNQLTQQWDKCVQDGNASNTDKIGCLRQAATCTQCDECQATYTYVTRSATATGSANNSGCYRSDSAAETLIAGCVVYSSATACSVCGVGYLKTTDNQCYNLYTRRSNSFSEGGVASGAVASIPEPCATATTVNTCTVCNSSLGADIALRKFAAAVFGGGGVERSHCFYNAEIISYRAGGSNIPLGLTKGCTTYADQPDSTFENSCTAVATGFALATVSSIGYSIETARSTGSQVANDFNCLAGNFSASTAQCTQCPTDSWLNDTNGQCETHGISNCVAATKSTGTCTACQAGYVLSKNPGTGGEQCHSLEVDRSSCGGNYYCATKSISVSWALNAPTYDITCATGYEQKDIRCVATTTLIPNCDKFNAETGNCQSCLADFVLIYDDGTANNRVVASTLDSTFSRPNLLRYRCVPKVANCIDIRANGDCHSCQNDPVTGVALYPDASKSVCIQATNPLRHSCAKFQRNSQDVCLECHPGYGLPADGCKLIHNCATFEPSAPNVCKTCNSGYLQNHKGVCVKIWQPAHTNCTTAYNSTTCMECDSGYALVTIEDNEEAGDIGVCREHVHNSIGCDHYDGKREKCLRCQDGWAQLDGICVPNHNDYPLLQKCVEYKYDTDQKSLYCSECARGYAIDGNYTRCILNNHQCADISGGNDCSLIKELKPFGTAFECDEYRSSANLLAISTLILSFLLLSLL